MWPNIKLQPKAIQAEKNKSLMEETTMKHKEVILCISMKRKQNEPSVIYNVK